MTKLSKGEARAIGGGWKGVEQKQVMRNAGKMRKMEKVSQIKEDPNRVAKMKGK